MAKIASVGPLVTINLIFATRQIIMPSVVDDDLDTIIDLPGSAHKPLTKAKLDQLALKS